MLPPLSQNEKLLQNAAEQWLKLMVVQLYLFPQPYDWLNKN